MWAMMDADFDCGTECGGPGPPPKFMIPPPPRPPFLHDLQAGGCSEDPLPDIETCDAIMFLDASFHSSPLLQTSAMIAICSLTLLLIVGISSLLVWKHKRKVQNFLPCKTPTRGGHLDSGGVVAGGGPHSVTYEDPDSHLGRRPLVIGHHHHHHHHNLELLHPKAIHYPSGYPMTRSPPLFICSSPGPDPYRSHDNVYEELGPPTANETPAATHRQSARPRNCESDAESDPPSHSDDDFAEDELSLPGECSFQKSGLVPTNAGSHSQQGSSSLDTTTASTASSTTTPPQTQLGVLPCGADQQTVATIYKDYQLLQPATKSNYIDGLIVEDNNNLINRCPINERNPLLMMSNGGGGLVNGNGMHLQAIPQAPSSPCCGATATGRSRSGHSSSSNNSSSLNRLMNPGNLFRGRKVHNCRNVVNLQSVKSDRQSEGNNSASGNSFNGIGRPSASNLMTLPSQHSNFTHERLNGSEFSNEVERRNQINRELSRVQSPNSLATIYQDRAADPNLCYPPPTSIYYPNTQNPVIPSNDGFTGTNRSRMNSCRSLDRRRVLVPVRQHPQIIPNYSTPSNALENNGHYYTDYTEPFQSFRTNVDYDVSPNQQHHQRSLNGHHDGFVRDSSFGSDSGYSQNTQLSQRSIPNSSSINKSSSGGSWFKSNRRGVS